MYEFFKKIMKERKLGRERKEEDRKLGERREGEKKRGRQKGERKKEGKVSFHPKHFLPGATQRRVKV